MLRMSKSVLWVMTLILASAFQVRGNPVFVVGGRIIEGDGTPLVNARVQVKNQTNLSLAVKEGATDASGVYKVLYVDLFDDVLVSLGDVFQVQVFDPSNVVVAVHTQTITSLEVANKFVETNMQLFDTTEDVDKTINLAPVDIINQVASYSIVSQPASGIISNFDPVSGQMLYSSQSDFNGSDSFVFQVVYGNGNHDRVVAKIAVSSVNDSPSVTNPITSIIVSEDEVETVVDLTDIFADVDIQTNQDQLSFSVSVTAGSSLLDYSLSGTRLKFQPLPDQNGTVTVMVIATDVASASVSHGFQLEINPVNDPPFVTNLISDIIVFEDAAETVVDLTGIFADIDIQTNQDQLGFSVELTGGDSLLNYSLAGTQLKFRPLPDRSGMAMVMVTATDTQNAEVTEEFSFTVTSVNDQPTIVGSIDPVVVSRGADDVLIDLSPFFLDSDILSVDATVSQDTQLLTIMGRVLDSSDVPLSGFRVRLTNQTKALSSSESIANANGFYQLVFFDLSALGVVASSGDDLLVEIFNDTNAVVVSQSYRLTSLDIAQKLADISFRGGQRFNGFPVRDSLTFSVQVLPANQQFLSSTIDGDDLVLGFASDKSGTATVTVTATDTQLASASASLTVTVNDPPVGEDVQMTVGAGTTDNQVNLIGYDIHIRIQVNWSFE